MSRQELIEKNLLLLNSYDDEVKDLIIKVLYPEVISLNLVLTIKKVSTIYTSYMQDDNFFPFKTIMQDWKVSTMLSVKDQSSDVLLFEVNDFGTYSYIKEI